MIATIEGKLVKLDADRALVQVGAIGYEVMLPSYCVNALADKVGSEISLCTMEYYEGAPGGGNMGPRIVGFLNSGGGGKEGARAYCARGEGKAAAFCRRG